MIEVKGVTKCFDGFRALDNISMTVPDGAVYGLVGPNGAGKSTVIRHLTGIYRQDSGEILVDGQPVFENPAVKSRIAYIPDDIFYFQTQRYAKRQTFTAAFTRSLMKSASKSSASCLSSTRSARCAGSQRACRSRRLSG